MPYFSPRSRDNLASCHPDLQRLFNGVIEHVDCTILEGHRSLERQQELYESGVTQVRRGRHNEYPSLAVDVAPWPIDWQDLGRFRDFANFVKGYAASLDIPVEWGGDWKSFRDMPHWQLPVGHK